VSAFKDFFKESADILKDKVDKVIEENPEVARSAKDIYSDVHKVYDESGAKEKIDEIKSKTSEKLDEVSGEAMYKLVQERLAEQDQFNDLVAAKLHEALERISELESLIKTNDSGVNQ